MEKTTKLWGSRFSEEPNKLASQFNSSIAFDQRLYKHDITGSIAHAEMLGKQGIIAKTDSDLIVEKLQQLLDSDIEIDLTAEDIHTFIESQLGEVGKRLHTGRSRNDQVALDMRLYCKSEINEIKVLLDNLMQVLQKLSEQHKNTIMPGFTHLQKAQPITLRLHLMAYYEMFKRDSSRLDDCYKRTDVMPLGSGALAGTTYPIDREFVREKLGFAKLTENTLDAVSDRDFCLEFLFCLSVIMTHLSRFCEEIILWSTDEFGLITISDAYSTGSSIMPQKKNPDMAELIRGKTGRVYGSLSSLLVTMKSLPLAYNKDMQESHEGLYDAIDTVKPCLSIFTAMIDTATFNTDKMYKSALGGYTNATDAADWLVKKGMAFREAHEVIGKLVVYAIEQNKRLDELTIAEFKAISDVFDESVFEAITVEACVERRNLN
jgi:argininosuccinate lyase